MEEDNHEEENIESLLEEFEEEVDFLRLNTVSPSTRKVYIASSAKFIFWLAHNKSHLCTQELLQISSNLSEIKVFLLNAPNNPPIHFSLLTAKDFLTWIVSLRKCNGEKPGYGAFNSHRAALSNLFRDYKVKMSKDLDAELHNHYTGLKRVTAKQIASGNGNIKVGKDAIDFPLYKFLGAESLKMRSGDFIFMHCFLLLCWNLACRAGNCVSICFSHLEWRNDALCIYFAHMKNDQMGEKPRDPRHVYANPINPEICPILAMAIYLICFPDLEQPQLFPGNNQYERYRKALERLLNTDNVKKELNARGIECKDIGTHSTRKGAATFCSSGSTACPSSAAICLRVGWALPGVQNTYIRYEAAGDMFVGRTLAGLPADQAEFAILPPFFMTRNEIIGTTIKACFPKLPENCLEVAEYLLASLVYHKDFLLNSLPKKHRLFTTYLFINRDLLDSLSRMVECRLGNSSDNIRPSGIPPHVSQLNVLKTVSNDLQKIIPVIQQVVPQVISGVVEQIEERAMVANTVTRDGLENVLNTCLERAGIFDLVQQVGSLRNGTLNSQPPDHNNHNNHNNNDTSNDDDPNCLFYWGGKFHRIPEDFEFPDGSINMAWINWCLKNTSKGYPPLRKITPEDFGNQKCKRKRLSDFRFLMNILQNELVSNNLWIEDPTIEQVNNMYYQSIDSLRLSRIDEDEERDSFVRRIGQIKWTSAVTIVRNNRKQRMNLTNT